MGSSVALVFVEFYFILFRFYDRGQDTRVPSAARTPQAETRAGRSHIGSDTARREDLFLDERGRLLILLLLVISTLVILLVVTLLVVIPLVVVLQWWWRWAVVFYLSKPR